MTNQPGYLIMKLSLVLAVALFIGAPTVLQAQVAGSASTAPATDSTAQPAARAGMADALDAKSTAELKETLEELALTLDRLARRVAEDPELRASAVRTASSFVGLAQVLVNQQALVLQGVLNSAAERLNEITVQPTP